jgi:DNA-directed RNA polymerase specialized sigma24 family protein
MKSIDSHVNDAIGGRTAALVRLCLMYGLSAAQIAEILGLPTSVVTDLLGE